MDHFLPEPPAATDADPSEGLLHWSPAWATTFSASLELAKQGDVALAQAEVFAAVQVSRIGGGAV